MAKRTMLATAMAVMAWITGAAQKSGREINAVTKAVIEAYSSQIAANKGDYEALLGRALELHNLGDLKGARADLDAALVHIPQKRSDLRVQAYTLRASVHRQSGRLTDALADLNSVVAIAPETTGAVFARAEIEASLGRYADAKADYRRVQRVNPRSSDALFGLARVAVAESNLGLAREYADQALEFGAHDSDSYRKRAEVLAMMGQAGEAADDLVCAVSLSRNDATALKALLDLAGSHYEAVTASLTRAIETTADNAGYRLLRAVVAEKRGYYADAVDDYAELIDSGNGTESIEESLARCRSRMVGE